jgi:hypothetical protein
MQCTKGWIAAAAVALVSSALPVAAKTTVTMEAEAMTLSSYAVENGNRIVLTSGALSGTASKTFSGASGTYNIQVYVVEESDGQPTLEVYKGSTLLKTYTYPLGTVGTSFTIANVALNSGDTIKLVGRRNAGAAARVDKVVLTQVSASTPTPVPASAGTPTPGSAGPVTIEAESMALSSFVVENGNRIMLASGALSGTASKNFGGASGSYNMQVYVQGESDGQPTVEVYKGATLLRTYTYPLGDAALSFTIANVALNSGDAIKLVGRRNAGAAARIDKVVLTPSTGSGTAYQGTPFSGTPIALPKVFFPSDFDRGGQNVAYFDTTSGNAGNLYRTSDSVDIRANTDSQGNGYEIYNFEKGEWLAYTVNVATSGTYDLAIRASNNWTLPVSFHIEIDGSNVTGTVSVPNTGGWRIYQWVGKQGVDLAAGKHVLKVVSEQPYFGMNAISVLKAGTGVTAGTGTSTGTVSNTPPAGSDFFCSFENSPQDCGFREQAKVPGRATLTSVSRAGSRGVRLQTQPGDSAVSGSDTWERDDLTLDQSTSGCYAGAEQWWSHSLFFPSDYVVSSQGNVVAAFHHTGGEGQANFQILAMPDGLRFTGAGGSTIATNSRSPGYHSTMLGQLVKNQWYDFVYHVKWSSGSDGFMFAWVNGVQKMAYRGPTLYTGQGCYLKLANYHGATGTAISLVHDRVVRGKSAAAVSSTPLQ